VFESGSISHLLFNSKVLLKKKYSAFIPAAPLPEIDVATSMALNDFSGLFTIFGIVIAFCIVAFFIERIANRKNEKEQSLLN